MTDTKPTLDLDALLAIVRRRTPGIWETGGPYPSTSVIVCVDGGSGWPNPEPPCYEPVAMIDRKIEGEPDPQAQADAAAIVTAVNDFEAVAERCKRAEEWNDYDATISELTRQRDEFRKFVQRWDEIVKEQDFHDEARKLLAS